MSRISIPTPESAPAASKPLLDGVRKKLGVVPSFTPAKRLERP
jgi:hypothetical protein